MEADRVCFHFSKLRGTRSHRRSTLTVSGEGRPRYETEKLPRPPNARKPFGAASGLRKEAGKLEETGRSGETLRVQPPQRFPNRRGRLLIWAAGFEVEVIAFFATGGRGSPRRPLPPDVPRNFLRSRAFPRPRHLEQYSDAPGLVRKKAAGVNLRLNRKRQRLTTALTSYGMTQVPSLSTWTAFTALIVVR